MPKSNSIVSFDRFYWLMPKDNGFKNPGRTASNDVELIKPVRIARQMPLVIGYYAVSPNACVDLRSPSDEVFFF